MVKEGERTGCVLDDHSGRVRERAGTRVIVSLWQDTPPRAREERAFSAFLSVVIFFWVDISGYRSVLHMAITVSEILSFLPFSPLVVLRYHLLS